MNKTLLAYFLNTSHVLSSQEWKYVWHAGMHIHLETRTVKSGLLWGDGAEFSRSPALRYTVWWKGTWWWSLDRSCSWLEGPGVSFISSRAVQRLLHYALIHRRGALRSANREFTSPQMRLYWSPGLEALLSDILQHPRCCRQCRCALLDNVTVLHRMKLTWYIDCVAWRLGRAPQGSIWVCMTLALFVRQHGSLYIYI